MNMEDYVRSSREADLAFLEATNTIAIAMDTESIDLFTEGADDKKSGFVDTIISKIRDLAEKIKKFFDDRAGECVNELYPTVTIRQIMWALKMKPLKRERWETCFDRKLI